MNAFSTKEQDRKIIGGGIFRYYLLIYILIAQKGLLPILALITSLPSRVLWVIPAPWIYLVLFVQYMSLASILITLFQEDVLTFIGIRQLTQSDAEVIEKLVTRGFLLLGTIPKEKQLIRIYGQTYRD